MMNSIRRSVGIVTALLWLLAGVTAFAEGELQAVKGPYDEQIGKLRTDCDDHLKDLSRQYTQDLQSLETQFKRAGDLDNVLVVRKELERFKDADAVTQGDIVETPASVATLQRGYITGKSSATKDRDRRIAKLAVAYVAQLEQLKRTLTQQDNIVAAVDVQKELEQVRDSGDLPAPAATRPPPKPFEPFTPATPAIVPTSTDNNVPKMMHTPKGTLWVIATDNGVPARGVSFFFQTEPDGKVARDNTDSTGKLVFRIDNGNTYRLVMVSDKYADYQQAGLKEGEIYPIKLQPRGQNEGVVEIHNRMCQLPEIGRLTVNGGWSSGNGEHGIDLHAENNRVRVQSSFRGMNMNGNTYSSSYFMVTDGQTATFQLGEVKYSVKAIIIGDHTFLSYKRL